VASETAKALKDVMVSVQKASLLISEITAASKEQAQGIDQVSSAVAQMNQTTQASAANAEESASASEELNAQVEQVNGIIQRLIAIVGGSDGTPNEARVAKGVRHAVGRLRHMTDDLLHHGAEEVQPPVMMHTLLKNQGKPRKVMKAERPAQKDPKEVIPLQEDEEEDEKVLKDF
jgi:hypothetical protein